MNRRRVATTLFLIRQHNYGCQCWVHQINAKREEHGEYHTLYNKDLRNYADWFYTYYPMTAQSFDYILIQIWDCIYKPRLNFWPSICPEEKLAVCIRYLATGDSITTIAYNFRLGNQLFGTSDMMFVVLFGMFYHPYTCLHLLETNGNILLMISTQCRIYQIAWVESMTNM